MLRDVIGTGQWQSIDLRRQSLATATECHDRAVAEFAFGLDDDVERWRAYWLRFIPLKEVTDRDHLLDGLRKDGLPA